MGLVYPWPSIGNNVPVQRQRKFLGEVYMFYAVLVAYTYDMYTSKYTSMYDMHTPGRPTGYSLY